MDWIKKNYEQFLLAVLALALLAASIWLVISGKGFLQNFASLQNHPPEGSKIVSTDVKSIEDADALLQKPSQWLAHEGSLFKSRLYVVDPKTGNLVDVQGAHSEMLHPPVPNDWFSSHGLNVFDPNVLDEDPDKDGFTNLDEWKWHTDVQKADSHPPYYARLVYVQEVDQPFHLIFRTYDGNPAKPNAITFQIHPVDIHVSSEFFKLEDSIPQTKYVLKSFTPKETTDANGIQHDISELTLENTETHRTLVLVMGKDTNDPTIFAWLRNTWKGSEDFRVKKGAEFSLKPETQVHYKVLDVTPDQVVIQTPTDSKVTIHRGETPNPETH